MKDNVLLSVVVQLLFEGIDDIYLAKTNNIFDDLWSTITNDGLQSITKYSDYIVKKVLNEQLNKQSVLFQALREYYRSNVFLSLSESGIKEKNNLYNLVLDDVVEEGWLSQIKSIENDLTPKRYRILLEKLSSFYKKQNLSQDDQLYNTNVDVNKLLPSRKKSSNKNSEMVALTRVTNENTTMSNSQTGAEKEDNQSSSSCSSMNDVERQCCLDEIYVSGLPKNISKKILGKKLHAVFSTCGVISHFSKTNGPSIRIFTQENDQSVSNGEAMIRFTKKESAVIAIGKYNGKIVPILNDAQITVRYYDKLKIKRTNTPSNFIPLIQSTSTSNPKENQQNGPVSFFWDIENVAIPVGVKAYDVILNLRRRLTEDRGLSEDIFKTYYRNIDRVPVEHRLDFTHAGILTQHIESNKYGAVDYQIHKDLQKFGEQHKTPATVVLISGDIDFINDLNELRFYNKHYVIIIHNSQARKELLQTANESISWEEFTRRKEQNTTVMLGNARKEDKQSQIQNIPKTQYTFVRSSSPRQNMVQTRPHTPLSNCSSSLELNVNKLDQTKKGNSKTAKNTPCVTEKPAINYNKKDSIVTTTQTNKLTTKDKAFSCSLCARKFTTITGLKQHEFDQHKVGLLIDVVSTMSTNDESNTNLIMFNDTDDNSQSQPDVDIIPADTSTFLDISSDESNEI